VPVLALSPSLSLGGVCVSPGRASCGRSSDLQAAYLLQLPSSWLNQCLCFRAFVPAYRCGAVPDFHRIPIFSLIARNQTPLSNLTIRVTAAKGQTKLVRWLRRANVIGLWEDAATGTAAGPLCTYLETMGFLGPDRTLLVEQGVLMGQSQSSECPIDARR